MPKFIRAGFFDIETLKEVIDQTQSKHIKVYCAIDEAGEHFLFLAPTQLDGRAREDTNLSLAVCCCTRPPCPDNLADRYAG
ncbi:hypothetical protein DYU11_01985 [Fibrisoma montanum]|uniref:Uncharacterized protein n=2 Tax=Fibrisoma montanum TaxID=2305895 RepID=A0A418MI58_9BACT|nr:hypothetical protein DYU11_01985 [Fibrisoma montanum]